MKQWWVIGKIGFLFLLKWSNAFHQFEKVQYLYILYSTAQYKQRISYTFTITICLFLSFANVRSKGVSFAIFPTLSSFTNADHVDVTRCKRSEINSKVEELPDDSSILSDPTCSSTFSPVCGITYYDFFQNGTN